MPELWRFAVQEGLARIKDNGSEDFTIICGDQQRKVHSLILSIHSPVLHKLCYGPFKETKERTADLSDDDVDALFAMIDWFYTSSWTYPRDISTLEFDCMMCVLADKYDVKRLKEVATERSRGNYRSAGDTALSSAAVICYENPKATDDLRPVLLQAIVGRDVWATGPYQETMAAYPEFAVDLLDATKKHIPYCKNEKLDLVCYVCGFKVDVYLAGIDPVTGCINAKDLSRFSRCPQMGFHGDQGVMDTMVVATKVKEVRREARRLRPVLSALRPVLSGRAQGAATNANAGS